MIFYVLNKKKKPIVYNWQCWLKRRPRETIIFYVESSWNVMAHGDTREGKWKGNWRMEWVASTLHTTSEHGVSSITTADAHTSAASSRLNWCPCRFKWTRPFRRKTKYGFGACAVTFQTQSTSLGLSWGRTAISAFCFFFTLARKLSLIHTLFTIRWSPVDITQHQALVSEIFSVYEDSVLFLDLNILPFLRANYSHGYN